MPRKGRTTNEAGRTLTFQVQVVGPIVRRIVDDGPRLRREVAVEHVSLWVTATQLQIIRFSRSLLRDSRLLGSQGPTRGLSSQRVHADEHMLLCAAANLEKALALFATDLSELALPVEFSELLRHLRNVYEHWEDYKPHVASPPATNRSGGRLATLQPTAQPWSIEIWPGEDVKVACVLSVRQLHNHLRRLAQQLRKLSA